MKDTKQPLCTSAYHAGCTDADVQLWRWLYCSCCKACSSSSNPGLVVAQAAQAALPTCGLPPELVLGMPAGSSR